MRKIFVLLLVVNVVFFAWMNLTEPKVDAENAVIITPQQEVNTLPIVLISEVFEPKSKIIGSSNTGGSGEGLLLGGLADEQQAKALLQRLMSLNIGGEVVERTSIVDTEYFAYIPAGESKRLALRMIDELRANSMDVALVESGALDNVISLGRFMNEAAASAQVERAHALGYQAEIKKDIKKQQTYWVAVNAESKRLIDEQVVSSLSGDFAELRYVEE